MSREIKFRGWYDGIEGAVMLPPQDLSQSREYWGWLGVNDVILMQFTGLTDKNGVDIYEGDIVAQEFTDPDFEPHQAEYSGPDVDMDLSSDNVVTFEDGAFMWSNGCIGDFYNDAILVIGNIHENGNLLS